MTTEGFEMTVEAIDEKELGVIESFGNAQDIREKSFSLLHGIWDRCRQNNTEARRLHGGQI